MNVFENDYSLQTTADDDSSILMTNLGFLMTNLGFFMTNLGFLMTNLGFYDES